MKAKILILSLSAIYALFLIGCKEERDEGITHRTRKENSRVNDPPLLSEKRKKQDSLYRL